jgi:hypothetical protein
MSRIKFDSGRNPTITAAFRAHRRTYCVKASLSIYSTKNNADTRQNNSPWAHISGWMLRDVLWYVRKALIIGF